MLEHLIYSPSSEPRKRNGRSYDVMYNHHRTLCQKVSDINITRSLDEVPSICTNTISILAQIHPPMSIHIRLFIPQVQFALIGSRPKGILTQRGQQVEHNVTSTRVFILTTSIAPFIHWIINCMGAPCIHWIIHYVYHSSFHSLYDTATVLEGE